MERLTKGIRPYLALTLLCLVLFLPGIAGVPPLDRDEPRFAQATRQMLETGDFIHINFLGEPRHQKPVGIYWLQAASVSLFSAPSDTSLWSWRLVSVAGAAAAVLLTFHAGRALFDRRVALAGAALLAASVLLVAEAHIAKTDAALLACMVAAQGALARIYLTGRGGARAGPGLAALFWAAVGLGILIKGPIVPMISGLTVLALVIAERRVGWLRGLRAGWGVPLAAAVALPWLVAISLKTDGAFLQGSVGRDLGAKLVGGEESHGFPPGYFLLLSALTLWPASLFLWPALAGAVRARHLPGVRFCLAWAIPAWVVFELVPTKLPHYTLPLHPALTLLIAVAVFAPGGPVPVLSARLAKLWYGVWGLLGLGLAAGLVAVPVLYGRGIEPAALLAGAAAAGGTAAALLSAWRRRFGRATLAALLGAAVTLAATFGLVMPRLDSLWLSRSIATALAAAASGTAEPVAVAGFREPSLVFLLGTRTVLTDGGGAAAHLRARPAAVVSVEAREEGAFQAALAQDGIAAEPLARLHGFNYSKGDWLTVTLYRRAGMRPADVPPAGAPPS